MKKTVIVNINGIIFHIDEDAYAKLNAYLDALHRYFGQQPEGKEIVSDIESRIAELLQPLINEAKQSVTIEDIEGIIETLGKPEDIAGDENQEKEATEKEQEPTTSHHFGRRLYRDPENSVIGGVCSGISAYFDIDPVFMRIIFIALIFAGGVSLIIYPILWIVIPTARTAAQKLEMRGENVTINNIEKTYHNTGQNYDNTFWGRLRNFISEVFSVFGKMFYAFWRVVVFLTGIFIILFSILMIICLIAAVFFNRFFIDEWTMNAAVSVKELLNFVVSSQESTWILIILFFVIFIPLIGLIYAGLKLVVGFKVKDKWAVLSLFLLWIASVIAGTILIASQINNFRAFGVAKETVALTMPKAGTISLSAVYKYDNEPLNRISMPPRGLFGLRTKNNKTELWGTLRMDIEKGSKSYPEMEIVREARGISLEEATNAAKMIKTSYTLTDSSIVIDPKFELNQGKWKFHTAKIVLYLPVGVKVYIDNNMVNFLENISNTNDYWDHDMVGKTWIMTENGLELMKNSKSDSIDLKPIPSHSLYIQKRENIQVPDHYFYTHDFGHITIKNNSFNFRTINFDIKKNENTSVQLVIDKNSPYEKYSNSKLEEQSITYSYEQKDSVLWLDPVFLLSNKVKHNDQEVYVTLYIPIDYKIKFSKDLELLTSKYADKHGISSDDLVNKAWKMTFDGLKEIEEKKELNE